MTHDHEALRLAIASLDFELTPAERLRMETGLAECIDCAALAASHIELAGRLQQLPLHDASPIVRQRVLRAALVPPRQRPWPVLLVAAALLGLLLAAAFAAGAFRTDPLDQLSDVPSVSVPSASPPALGDVDLPGPSESPTSVPSPPGPDSGGGSVFGAPLAPDTLAQVVSGRLRIRSEPRVADDSIRYEPLLDVGVRLLILDGPVVANDYEWYHVLSWDPDEPGQGFPYGWVSRGDHDGTPWIRPIRDACPTGEATMHQVAQMTPPERVACLGDRSLRLRGYITGPEEQAVCDDLAPCIDGPRWLAGDVWVGDVDVLDTPGPGRVPFVIAPDSTVLPDSIPSGSMAELEGAFDHPAAQDCRVRTERRTDGQITDPGARFRCRANFAVRAVDADDAYPTRNAPAITVSDRLRVRSAPGLQSERHELLPLGTPVWVVDGPVIAADYDWFEVVVPGIEVDGAPRVGWVAESDHGGERWLARCADAPPPGERVVDVDALTDYCGASPT